MTSEDRELLFSLRRQQTDLQQALETLGRRLDEVESRAKSDAEEHGLPELPAHHFLPALPLSHESELPLVAPAPTVAHEPPPVPAPAEKTPVPPTAPSPTAPKPSFEFQFGRWLTRIGAVLAVLFLILFDFYLYHEKLLGPWGIFASGAALSFLIIVTGQWLERKDSGLLFSRTVLAIGLAFLYVTIYAGSTVEGLQVVHRPLLGGILLLLWSVYVLVLAERKQSQTLSLFAIALAYFSSAINPMGGLTMGADLLLAGTALVFLLRNGWAVLSYVCLVGTYLAPLRRLMTSDTGELTLEPNQAVHFTSYAVYLVGAWVIFTACVLLSTAPTFRGGKRLAFLTLNNGCFTGLLLFVAYLAGYGSGEFGDILLATGTALLLLSVLTRWTRAGTSVMQAYLAQGLVLITGGLVVTFTGVSRGLVLAIETFFLGAAAAVSRNVVLGVCAALSAFFTTLFLLWEISANGHHPWVLGLGGAAIMLFNARWTRGPLLSGIKLASAYYVALALALIYAAMQAECHDETLPPALALVSLALTFSVYLVRIPALPPLVQSFLVVAQFLVLFPSDTGETLPWWSPASVATATLLSVLWWSRQTRLGRGWWVFGLNCVYSLALVGLAHQAVRPYVGSENWMVDAALLSFFFLAFGALTRTWTLAAIGQVFLAISLYHFLFPDGATFPWSTAAAAVPIAIVFATGRAALNWLRLFPQTDRTVRELLYLVAYAYYALALALVVRLIFAEVPGPEQIATLFFLATFLVSWNIHQPSPFGLRCGGAVILLGAALYFVNGTATFPPNCIDALAVIGLLSLIVLLRPGENDLLTGIETSLFLIVAVMVGWVFVSDWISIRINPHGLTIGWALYALFLFLFGFALREKRLLWAGALIFAAALARAAFSLFSNFSDGATVLTIFLLTVIALGLGFVFARFGDRLKTWL